MMRHFISTSTHHRRGLTLIELVVVIGVLAILMSVAIPTLRYSFKDRKLREGTRQLTAILERAKARATEIERPAGVWIEPLGNGLLSARQGVRIYLCEVPRPFTGSTPSSTARLVAVPASPTPPPPPPFLYYVQLSSIDAALLAARVQPGQPFEISFDHRGPTFSGIRNPAPTTPLETFVIEGPPSLPAFLANNRPVPFEAHTPPVKTSDEPVELPGDTVIDLGVSGFGVSGNEFDAGPVLPTGNYDNRPIAVLFSPRGGIASVIGHGQVVAASAPVHLLVGRNNGVVYPKQDPSNPMDPGQVDIATVPSNLMDTSTVWVSINHRTGQINTAENADSSSLAVGSLLAARISIARQIARTGTRMGGR